MIAYSVGDIIIQIGIITVIFFISDNEKIYSNDKNLYFAMMIVVVECLISGLVSLSIIIFCRSIINTFKCCTVAVIIKTIIMVTASIIILGKNNNITGSDQSSNHDLIKINIVNLLINTFQFIYLVKQHHRYRQQITNPPEQPTLIDIKIVTEKTIESCIICFDQLITPDNSNYIIIKCGHKYHQECLSEWIKIKSSCPICRFEIK